MATGDSAIVISRVIGKINRLQQYLGLMLRNPGESLLVLRLLITNRVYLREWLRFSDAQWLQNLGVRTVIDIGAHTGSLCFGVAKMVPGVQIYAFEPLRDNYAALQKLAKNINLKTFNVAVGNEEGEKTFFQNIFSASSSALPMARTHKEEFPHTSQVTEIRVPFWRLDNHQVELTLESPVLLVLDVQGYEFEALKGADKLLANVDIIICEISADQLYDRQASFDNIYSWLHEKGFNYGGDFDCLKSPIDGRVLQIDAIFTRIV